ncbi:MAG TPA: hypothetical protein VGD23_11105 [Sphingomicrobium sp.]
MHFSRSCLVIALALAPATAPGEQWSTSGDGMKCFPLRRADAVRLWIASDEPNERKTAVEGSRESAARRDDGNAPLLFFEVRIRADRPIQKCMRLRWRVEPWGQRPVDAADFGGKLPSGTVDVIYNAHHDEAAGTIQVWVPNDDVRERPETFRIVLLDPVTRRPLAGTVGAYDPGTGMRARNRPAQSLNMTNRLVMTVLDAPGPRSRE